MHNQTCSTKYTGKKHSDLFCHLQRSGYIISKFCPLSWVSDNSTNTEKHTKVSYNMDSFTISKKEQKLKHNF